MNDQSLTLRDLGGLSDQELTDLVHAGVRDAEGVLYARHFGDAVRVAHGITGNLHVAEDVAADAFEKIFVLMRSGQGPDRAFRGYLHIAVSRTAAVAHAQNSVLKLVAVVAFIQQPRSIDEQALHNLDTELAATAFESLPPRWRAVLQLTEVEGMKPAAIAGRIGLSPNATSVLLKRARAGLRAAFVQAHVPDSSYPACRFVLRNYGSYVTGKLASKSRTRIDGHLRLCATCAAVHEENRRLGS